MNNKPGSTATPQPRPWPRVRRRAVGVAVAAAAIIATTLTASPPSHAAGPRPLFQLPVTCNETWRLATYAGHDDYDIDMTPTSGSAWGRPILASYGGTVTRAGIDGTLGNRTPSNPGGAMGTGGGYYVKVNHGNGWETLYLHMLEPPIVSVGQTVVIGQQLGKVGSTGSSSGPHLHYEQLADGNKIESWFNGVRSGITHDNYSYSVTRVSNNCGGGNVRRGIASGDVTGDGRSDLIARRPDGTLWLYRNGGSNTAPYSTGTLIGTGWEAFSWFLGGDVTGDNRADVVAARPDGTLWLYRNGGSNTSPYSTATLIGSAWAQFIHVTLADVTGDGRADLVAARPDGTLWLYPNGGSNTAPYSTATQIGVAWAQFSEVVSGDVGGDGYADLVAARPDGTLWLYLNGGNNTAPYSTGTQIGIGWETLSRLQLTDVTGDDRADIVATRADGTLWLYRNGGAITAPYSTGILIGSGWEAIG